MGERAQEIERRLDAALAPGQLEVIDDSDDHSGHAGQRARAKATSPSA